VSKIAAEQAEKKKQKRPDRRIRQTRDALGDALIALMQEKPFDQITVQHVLDRADVSRSTFYAHFRDKNDLFLSDVEDFLEHIAGLLSLRNEASNRVAPVREFFAHVGEWHKFHGVLVAAGKMNDFVELGQGYFARAIERRLKELPATQSLAPQQQTVLAQMHAGAMFSLLRWWMAKGMTPGPEKMDELFHDMVWKGATSPTSSISSSTSRRLRP
jgi:AcrR family transcriptional regulator